VPEDDFLVESNGSVVGTLFESRYRGDPPTRLIAQAPRFAVLADLAPLCAGHVLIVPRRYYPSLGALPPEGWDELEQLLTRVADAVSHAFRDPLIFEHGSSSYPQHSPCVSHAHLHVIPAEVDLAPDLRRRGFEPKSIASLRELSDLAARDCAYVCWGSARGSVQVAEVEAGGGIPRQYLRRELAAVLGSEEWDWGVPAMPDLLRTTVRELSPRLDADPTLPSGAEAPGPVIAIDGPAGAGKTTSGVWLARRLGLPLIESGYLFRGVAAAPDGLDSLSRVDIDVRVPPGDEWRPSLRVGDCLVEEVRAPAIEERLAPLVKQPQVRSAIAQRVTELSERNGGVVLGRRTATESCPTAPARVLMTADEEVRLRRRSQADVQEVADRRYGDRLRAREPILEGEELTYTMKLDTTEMSIGEVREALWRHVQERLAS